MNKKFSTLVAALLVSGGLAYTVGAMVTPATESADQTYVTASALKSANSAVVGYTLGSTSYDQSATVWKVVVSSGSNYLTVNGADDTWALSKDLKFIKIAEGDYTNALAFTVETDGTLKCDASYLSIEGTSLSLVTDKNKANVGLFDGSVTEAKTTVSNDDVRALGAIVKVAKALATTNQYAAKYTYTLTEGVAAKIASFANIWTDAQTFTVEADEGDLYLYITDVDGNKWYMTKSETSVVLSKEKSNNAKVTIDGSNVISLGSTSLKVSDGSLSVASAASGEKVYAYTATSAASVSALDAGTVYYLANVADANNGDITSQAVTPLNVTETMAVAANNAQLESDLTEASNTAVVWDLIVSGDQYVIGKKGVLNTYYLTGVPAVTSNLNEAAKFSLDENGQLVSGSLYLYNAAENKLSLGSTAQATINNRMSVYAVSGEGAIASAASTSLAIGRYVLAASEIESHTSNTVLSLTAVSQVENAPGMDIPGMADANVIVSAEGVITAFDNTQNIPVPATIAFEGSGTLSVNDKGEVVFLTGEDAKKATAWVLVKGLYKSVELEKAGKTDIYLSYTAPQTNSLSSRASSAATGFKLVSSGDATTFSVTPSGIQAGDVKLGTSTLTVAGIAPAATVDSKNETNLIHGALSNGAVVRLAQGAYYAGQPTTYVVEVAKGLSGTFEYKFRLVGTNSYLTAGTSSVFTSAENEGAGMALMADGQYLTIAQNGSYLLTKDQVSTAFYKAAAETKNFSAQYIIETRGTQSSFNLSLWDEEDGSSNLIQNPFADADLVPMTWDAGKKELVKVTDASETFLLKKGNSYIVLNVDNNDVWGNMGNQVSDGGYKFATVSAATMEKFLKGELADRNYFPYFTFSYDKNGSGLENDGSVTAKTPIYQISVSKTSTAATATDYKLVSFELTTGGQKGIYLTVDKAGKHKVYAEFSASNAITGDLNKDYNPLKMQYVNISFANHSSIRDVNDTKIVLNGRVLGAHLGSADKSEFLFNKPEGQWVVKMTGAADAAALSKNGAAVADLYDFTFVNRESGAKYKAEKIYYLGGNKYAVQSSTQLAKATGDVAATRDTLIITPVATELKNNLVQMDGYANLKALDVQDEQFRLLIASTEQDYYVGENHSAKSHFLGLSHEESASVNWRIVPLTEKRAYDSDGLLKTASDSIYIFNHPQSYNADKKAFFASSDTVAIVSYALQNTANGEYLTYEAPQTTTIQSMICDPNFTTFKTTKDVAAAYRFVLKEKADGLYNVIGVDGSDVTYDKDGYLKANNNPFYSLDLGSKLYGATTLTKQGAVEVEYAYSQINSNDLFKVQQVAAPEYRKLAQGDTIRIFRDENNFDTMYENGEFLNLGNTAQLKDMAPALYVDTAYVNRSNGHENRYQYLLAVNVDRVEPAYCDIPNHPALHPDTTYGRFLVNLVDSAVYTYRHGAIHTNKYINNQEADEVYVKLGFVWGYRTADKLFLTEGKDFTKVNDVIDLSTRDFNIAKFAFRYVNPTNADDQSFKIQTRYINYDQAKDANKKDWAEHNEGYLKTINGVVVVTDKYAKGEEFNLAAEKSTPTSNDQIGATEVSVIAGAGSVVVKNAAGKTVAISNILGQTIVNTVLTSDNATISVPAGIVVVAVEGEEAVKTVVK